VAVDDLGGPDAGVAGEAGDFLDGTPLTCMNAFSL